VNLHELMIPLGILTYTSLFLTMLSGFLIFKYHVKWVKLKWHMYLGIFTLVVGTMHAGIALYIHIPGQNGTEYKAKDHLPEHSNHVHGAGHHA